MKQVSNWVKAIVFVLGVHLLFAGFMWLIANHIAVAFVLLFLLWLWGSIVYWKHCFDKYGSMSKKVY